MPACFSSTSGRSPSSFSVALSHFSLSPISLSVLCTLPLAGGMHAAHQCTSNISWWAGLQAAHQKWIYALWLERDIAGKHNIKHTHTHTHKQIHDMNSHSPYINIQMSYPLHWNIVDLLQQIIYETQTRVYTSLVFASTQKPIKFLVPGLIIFRQPFIPST